jgi:hypothetical protein
VEALFFGLIARMFGHGHRAMCGGDHIVEVEAVVEVDSGQRIAPQHGGFENRFEYLYVESTSTTRTKLLNLRVNLRVDS